MPLDSSNFAQSSLAVLFPGQGSQEPNMGRDLADAHKEYMDVWKKAEQISCLPLRGIYWDGDSAAMADTRALQPALTVVNLNLWAQASKFLQPRAVAGHSLGEYSALAAAGVLSLNDTLELVSLRGRLMAEADPSGQGAMSAVVRMPLETVEEIVRQSAETTGELLLVANYNTPAQFVLSGTKTAINHAADAVKAQKGRALPLAVSGAFHSPLMQEAANDLEGVIRKKDWHNARCAVYCNATGASEMRGDALQTIMVGQMTHSVQWIACVSRQWQDGIHHWLELGPKNVLGKMLSPILKECGAEDGAWQTQTVRNEEELCAWRSEHCA